MHAMPPIYITFLNRPDVEALALTDDEILAAVEAGLAAQGRGETVIEPRVHLRPAESQRPLQRAARRDRRAARPRRRQGRRRLRRQLQARAARPRWRRCCCSTRARACRGRSSTRAGITDMRTGAVTAIGAKHLARKNSRCSAISARAARPTGTCACSTTCSTSTRSASIRAARRAATPSPRG